MAKMTLLDIAIRNGSDPLVGLIDETIAAHPEISEGDARTIKGISYRTRVRTALPTVAFRNANDGSDAVKGRSENRTVETYILDVRWEVDKAVADRSEDGPEAVISEEAQGIMLASMKHLSRMFYYGRDVDAKGFPGLTAAVDSDMVVDATGTSSDAGTSVWLVRWGVKDVRWVWGYNGSLDLSDVRIETITGENDKSLDGYVQTLLAYPGLQVGNKYSVGRIRNLTTQTGKTLTDDMIADALSKFPSGYPPEVIYMNQQSLKQLRQSRTATNATGAPAPFPTEAFNIPIRPTDSIGLTESVTSDDDDS